MIEMTRTRLRFVGFVIASLVLTGPVSALDLAVPHVSADYVWAQGYTGTAVEIGIIDLFVADSNHPAINGNFLGSQNFAKGATFLGEHATLVTGAAVSQDPTYTGVAPDAGWWTGQTTNAGTITKVRNQTVAVETFAHGLGVLAGNPAEVLSLSIGLAGNTLATDQWSLGIDHVVRDSGRTVTVAAGNDGPNGSTLAGLPTGAYNAIIVGATGGTVSGHPSEDYSNLASYSSRGPTDDGRSKPDIVAPGSWMHVPTPGSGWGDFNGTSIATPVVAGGAALMIEVGLDLGYSTDARVIKSTLMNSADKLTGWGNTSTRPLDWNQGAGQLNLENAYNQYIPGEHDPGTVEGIGWDLQEVSWDTENFYTLDGTTPAGEFITATLAWDRIVTDDPAGGDIDDIVYNLDHLDNLDLHIYDASDLSTPLASSISTIDNVEHIHYSVAQTSQYVLGAKMTGASPGDLETYGLAWHALTDPIPLDGDVTGDGFVGADDLVAILTNWGMSGATRQEGDLTGEGFVGADDYVAVLTFWGNTSSGPEPLPEPGVLLVLLVGAVGLGGIRTNRPRQKT